jgi:GntR family transcriptional regulator/MocR family aminotransferase
MDLHIRLDGRANLARQIYRQVRAGILDGRLRAGEALPPSRELAARVGVSRNTVNAAYGRLEAEGFLTSRTGAGTFVSSLPEGRSGVTPDARPDGPLRPRPVWEQIRLPDDFSAEAPMFDFRAGAPDVRMFPYPTWRRLVGKQLQASTVGTGMPGEPAGHPALRAAIVRHFGVSRALQAAPDDVLVTSGIQQALDLVGRALLEPGACVAAEEPGYTPPQLLFWSLGARVAGVPVDREGLVVDAIPADARLVYVTPSHQLPTGVAMSLRRRMQLLAWAEQHHAAILEDDYDGEFRYNNQALEPLQSLDRGGRVVYLGSFSKILLPTLRLGFLVAPPSLRHALRAAKFVSDWHTSLPNQAALAEFIDQGGLARHVRRVRNAYHRRHERIVAALEGPLSPWLELIPSAAGLHVSAYLREGTAEDATKLVAHAAAGGVGLFDFAALSTAGATPPGIVLGYGAIPTDRVDAGLRRLHECLCAWSPR